MNGSVVILGASGGVGKVVVHKCVQVPHIFKRIVGASRDISQYAKINKFLAKPIEFRRVDASSKQQLVALIESVRPDLLINVGIPFWNLNAMKACLDLFDKTGHRTHYMDTACWEPEYEARFRHAEQWSYDEDFKKAELMGLIGCGFDPGETNAMVAYAYKHYFRRIDKVQIWDCNGGFHGKAFATNFSLAINLRELLGRVRYRLNGKWKFTPSLIDEGAIHFTFDFEEIGKRELYLMYHEELESLAKNFPEIKEMSFWMTFSEQYLRCLRMFVELGLTSIEKMGWSDQLLSPLAFLQRIVQDESLIKKYETILNEIGLMSKDPVLIPWDEELPWDEQTQLSPLEVLQVMLPDPSSLGQNYTGKTNIGVIIEGIGFDGKPLRWRIFNICDHAECWREVRAQAISYTTGVAAFSGAMMMVVGKWMRHGVFNVEQFDPDSFIQTAADFGLPIREDIGKKVPLMYEFDNVA